MMKTAHKWRCEKDTCIVCASLLERMQEVIQPLYVRVLLKQSEDTDSGQNTTLGDYQ